MNILVSACIMGVNCRYNDTGFVFDGINELMETHHLIPVCPEIFGGLPTPREPAEIVQDRVLTKSGVDVTAQFKKGADEVLSLAKAYHCTCAILKERSPSCGYGIIHDGTFTGTLIPGNGVLAQLLSDNGIKVYGESRIKELL